MTGAQAWVALAAGVVAYELCATEGQLMSEACARGMMRRPWVVRGGIVLVAAHLLRVIPPAVDPLHQATRLRPRRIR